MNRIACLALAALALPILLGVPHAAAAPKSVVDLVAESRQAAAAGDLGRALDRVEEGIRLDPAYLPLWKQKARVHLLRSEPAKALEATQPLFSQSPNDPETRTIELEALLGMNDAERFMKSVREGSSIPALDDPQGVALAISVLEHPSSSAYLRPLLERWTAKSDDGRLLLDVLRLAAAGNEVRAISRLRTYRRNRDALRPLAVQTAIFFGDRYARKGEPTSAISLYELALSWDPSSAGARRELGWTLRRAGRPAAAADVWEAGWERSADPRRWLEWIVEARHAARQWAKARTAVERAIALDPENAVLRGRELFLIGVLGERGESDRVTARLREKQADAALALATALELEQKDDYAGALRSLESEEVQSELAGEADAMRRRWIQAMTKKKAWGEAERAIQASLEYRPGEAGLMRDLGWTQWAKGDRASAVASWDAALAGGLAEKDALVVQATRRLLESGDVKTALSFYGRWSDRPTLLPLAYSLVDAEAYPLARLVLLEALDRGEQAYWTTLYLALCETRLGDLARTEDLLKGWLASLPAEPPAVTFSTVGEEGRNGVVTLGAEDAFHVLDQILGAALKKKKPRLVFLVDAIEERWASAPFFERRLPAYHAQAGTILLESADSAAAERHLRKSLEGDPHRAEVWLRLAQVQMRTGASKEAEISIERGRRENPAEAILARVLGDMALVDGDRATAARRWRESLAADPKDDDLRSKLIRLSIALHRYDEAKSLLQTFEQELAGGNLLVRDRVALHRAELGDLEGSLALWEKLAEDRPQNTGFQLNRARLLFQLCRADEAVDALEPLFVENRKENWGVLLTEIAAARNDPVKEDAWAAIALASNPKSKPLLRARAEAAERLHDPALVERSARAYLELDPDSAAMQVRLGQALMDQGKWPEAREHYDQLLARNPGFQIALVKLREIEQRANDTDRALEHTKAWSDVTESDPESLGRLGVSYAEDKRFSKSFEILRRFSSYSPDEALPILLYRGISSCDYPGMMTLARWEKHVRRLHAEGYRFLGIERLAVSERSANGGEKTIRLDTPLPDGEKAAFLAVADVDPQILLAMDEILAEIDGHALLVVGATSLSDGTPLFPDRDLVGKLEKTGRWQLALSDTPTANVDLDVSRVEHGSWMRPRLVTVGADHGDSSSAGNTAAGPPALLAARFDELLAGVGEPKPRVWVYPGGDDGQRSLDADPRAVAAYRGEVQSRFEWAIVENDQGFIAPFSPPSRLTAKAVPWEWSEDRLLQHLRDENPFRRAALELAIVTMWHRQHELADDLFIRARELGADEQEVSFRSGVNAYYVGDIPTAIERTERATELDPSSERNRLALEEARSQEDPIAFAQGEWWEDSDDREFLRGMVRGKAFATNRLSLNAFAGRTRWERDGFGDSRAWDFGGGARWYFLPQYWLDGELSRTIFDDGDPGDDFWGFQGALRGPIHWPGTNINGFYRIEGAREAIDTLEAVAAETLNRRITVSTYQRIGDHWDVFVDGHRDDRTDGNDTLRADGRIVRRLTEWPLLGVGYAFRFGDSDRDPPEYYAPVELQQHQAYLTLRGDAGPFIYALSGAPGYAKAKGTDWRFVWTARAEVGWQIGGGLGVSAIGSRFESPDYELTKLVLQAAYRF